MELLLKQILPILFFFLLLFEIEKNKSILFTLALFWSYISFGSNYSLPPYRVLYQVVQLIVILYYLAYYRFDFHYTKVGKQLLVFLLFILLSYLGNGVQLSLYLSSVINFITIYLVLSYLFKAINTTEKLEKVFTYITKLVFLTAIFTVIAFIVERTRIELTTNNPNYLAYFLGLGFCTAYTTKNKTRRLIELLTIGASIMCTSSRIILIAMTVVVVIHVLSNKRTLVLNILGGTLAVLIAIGVLNVTEMISSKRFRNIDEDASTLVRVEIIETSKKIVAANPFNGVGYNQFQNRFSNYVSATAEFLADTDKIVTHNDFLRIVDELGIPALLFMFYIIISQVIIIWKLPVYQRNVLLTLLITDILYSTSHNNLNAFVFWFFLMLPTMAYYINLKEAYVKEAE